MRDNDGQIAPMEYEHQRRCRWYRSLRNEPIGGRGCTCTVEPANLKEAKGVAWFVALSLLVVAATAVMAIFSDCK